MADIIGRRKRDLGRDLDDQGKVMMVVYLSFSIAETNISSPCRPTMQGFNRRVEPDYDPRQHSTLNARQGIKALGKRDRRDDLGYMVVR